MNIFREETDLYKLDYDNIIGEFSGQIKQFIGGECHSMLTPNFTTTTLTSKVACEIALMDAMKVYFDYGMTCGCGISKV